MARDAVDIKESLAATVTRAKSAAHHAPQDKTLAAKNDPGNARMADHLDVKKEEKR